LTPYRVGNGKKTVIYERSLIENRRTTSFKFRGSVVFDLERRRRKFVGFFVFFFFLLVVSFAKLSRGMSDISAKLLPLKYRSRTSRKFRYDREFQFSRARVSVFIRNYSVDHAPRQIVLTNSLR